MVVNNSEASQRGGGLPGIRAKDTGAGPPLQWISPLNSHWLERELLKTDVSKSLVSSKAVGEEGRKIYPYHSLRRQAEDEHRKNIEKYRPEVIIHRSDEKLRHRASNYGSARLVFRDYFNPNLCRRNTYFIPVGFNEQLVEEIRVQRSERGQRRGRTLNWAFVGNVKGDREAMLLAFRYLVPGTEVTNTSGFMKNLAVADSFVAEA